MPARPRFGIVALCDAVYKDESSNKVVIAGLFNGDIITTGEPNDLLFALYAEIFSPDTDEHTFDLSFWVGQVRLGGATGKICTPRPKESVAVMIPKFGLRGKIPAVFQVKLSIDGGPSVKILEKRLILAD